MDALPVESDPVAQASPQIELLDPLSFPDLPPLPTWTIKQYFALEDFTQTRFEYLDGQIYAMTGGTNNHSAIKMNAAVEIGRQIRGTQCSLRNNDMRVKVDDRKYVYPDLSVVCGAARLTDNNTTLLNPVLVVELLSPSSVVYDRSTKLDFYRSIPSVQAYLIIDQHQILVELHARTAGGWHWQIFSDIDDVVPLEALAAQLPLSEVYRDITIERA